MFEWCFWLVACVVHADAWLCILSSPPCVGHQVVMVYILSGGVPNRLPASWVMLLARHCLHIPSPVGYFWSTRANHGGIKVQKDQKACWILLVVSGSMYCHCRQHWRCVLFLLNDLGWCSNGAFDWWHVWCMRTHGCVFSAAHHVLGTRLSWCISSVVASQTDCRKVESCSLRGTASIFLALWVTSDPQGQTMEASKSKRIKRLVGSCW